MAKKKSKSAPKAEINTPLVNESNAVIQNGLADAFGLGSFNAFGIPTGSPMPGSDILSQPQTMFKSLRWYLVSNFRQFLSELYVENGLVQTIVDVPVDDALRGGVKFSSGQLEEEQLEELSEAMERDDDFAHLAEALKWNRLFGGGAIIVWVADQDPSLPLDVNAITKDTQVAYVPVDMWELYWSQQTTEDTTDSFIPLQQDGFEHYDFYGEKLHKSRVFKIKGLQAPSFIRPRLRGWGFSIIEVPIRSINQYLKSTNLAFEVLDEFKLDIFKMKNLMNTLTQPMGEQKVAQRVQLANKQKNYQNAMVMDMEDDFDHKQLSFAGLADVMTGVKVQIAADLRMPMTKLFGISSAGFNSGEDDIEVYNAMVESTVRRKAKKPVLQMAEIKCQQLFGTVPDDLACEFEPLRVLSAEQEENVKTQKFNRVQAAKQAGELNTLEYREALNKGNLLDITLDTDEATIGEIEEGQQEAAELEAGAGEESGEKPKAEKGKGSKSKEAPQAKEAKEPKQNSKHFSGGQKLLKVYTRQQRIERVLVKNSAEFDRASYEADGGDAWIDPRRRELFENPGNVDEALWSKAKDASQKAFGQIKWQFVTWWYKKQGGNFH